MSVSLPRVSSVLLLAVLALLVFGGSSSFAASPWWQVSSGARPGVLPSQPGGRGEVFLTVENLGDRSVDGSLTPVRISDVLPPGLKALGISAGVPFGNQFTPFGCEVATLSCTFTGGLPAFDALEVRVEVEVLPGGGEAGEVNMGSVSGGGAPPVSVQRPLRFGEAGTPFGVEDYESRFEEELGAPAVGAGSHPFQFTTTVALNQGPDSHSLSEKPETQPAVLAKDIYTKLPAGFFGDPLSVGVCSESAFLTDVNGIENECAAQSAVGVASVTVNVTGGVALTTLTQPVFNLEPYAGEPARFGFFIAAAGVPVLLDPVLRSDGDYGITIDASNISQTAGLISARVTIWGAPGDSRHDGSRGWGCIYASNNHSPHAPCEPSLQAHPAAFLTMPSSCAGPLQSSVEADSWVDPGAFQTFLPPEVLPTLDGCNRLAFAPVISASPTTTNASAPSGLDFNLDFHDEGLLNGEGVAESQLKDTTVILPEGMTIDPSAGVGLAGCTPADYARESLSSAPGAGCPNESKLGEVTIETPLLSTVIHGSIFIAQPYENPFDSLVALYVVAKSPLTGVLVKLAGKVDPNPSTGQLTTTFQNNPQLPFDHFNFHFREGQQAPLITPPLCGAYSTQANLTPWSEPLRPLAEMASFTLTKGFDGGGCPPGSVPPFTPRIQAGTLNNNAGSFSALYVHLTRSDAEQEIAGFSTDLPPGLTGDLTGIPFCPEASIAAARAKTGAAEEASPSCPAASQIGHTLVGTGVAAVLAYVPGKIYLAGPYNGDPFSIVSVTSAKVGPFDLGTVVLRFALRIDPHTAQVSVDPSASEPIPTIIDGIVTHVRDIRVYIDRHDFTLNPTSCNPLSISSTLTSPHGQTSTVSSPFQASNCQALKFAPKFQASTQGKTSKSKGASLSVKLTYPNAPQGSQANIAKVKVDLPKMLPSRLTTLQKACTAKQFDTNPAGCPVASIIGHAKAITPLIPVPLEGPAYFVSNGSESFPNLIIVLQGYGITIDLVGDTFISKAGITSSTFKTVPDQPVGSFELTLPQGKYSALAANGNLCTNQNKLKMPTEFLAQNGAKINESTKITVTGCAKKKASKHHKAKPHFPKVRQRRA